MYQPSMDQKSSPLPPYASANRGKTPSPSQHADAQTPSLSSQHTRVEGTDTARADTNQALADQAGAQSPEEGHVNGIGSNVSGTASLSPHQTQNVAAVGESGLHPPCLASSAPGLSDHKDVSTVSTSRRQNSSIPSKTPRFVSCNPGLQHTTRMPLSQSLGLEGCSGIFGGFVGILGIFGFLCFLWFGCKSSITISLSFWFYYTSKFPSHAKSIQRWTCTRRRQSHMGLAAVGNSYVDASGCHAGLDNPAAHHWDTSNYLYVNACGIVA